MAEYAKRTCFDCGIRLPKPIMREVEVSRIGENGRVLSTIDKWMCVDCWEAWRAIQEAPERAMQQRLAEEAMKTEAGKRAWEEEQERRRLANLTKRLP